jgi:hypothetical protein
MSVVNEEILRAVERSTKIVSAGQLSEFYVSTVPETIGPGYSVDTDSLEFKL